MTLQKALEIAQKAHAHQRDKSGQPYLLHVLRVMEKGKNETEKICGLLHDLIEDTTWTLEDLRIEGFSDAIITILDCLTHRTQESYETYIARIRQHPVAIRIKINDLEDNMDIRRLPEITSRDVERLNKYLRYYRLLLGDLEG